jgi:hypothetical protein
MARGSDTSNQQLVAKAHQALDNMKYEIAAELGLPVHQGSEDYWGNITARDCGAVGGKMVRQMIRMAEEALANSQTKE